MKKTPKQQTPEARKLEAAYRRINRLKRERDLNAIWYNATAEQAGQFLNELTDLKALVKSIEEDRDKLARTVRNYVNASVDIVNLVKFNETPCRGMVPSKKTLEKCDFNFGCKG